MDVIRPYIPFLVPILVLQLGLLIFALIDLIRRPAGGVNGPKWLWIIMIVVINIIGPIAYFLIGRREE
jgi:hypothetical protein